MKHSAWLLLLASPAVADEIVLRNGARFTGAVTREKGRVHIRMDVGTMSFAAVDVASVKMSDDPVVEVERRASTLPKNEEPRRSPAAEIRERLEAEARERDLERQRSAEESRLDAMLSLERDRIDLERARLEQERKLELSRQRLEALHSPVVAWPAHPRGHERRAPRRFPWPIWGP
jgi:hypothetical protein